MVRIRIGEIASIAILSKYLDLKTVLKLMSSFRCA